MSPCSLPAHRALLSAVCLLLPPLSLSLPEVPHIALFFGTKTRYEEVNRALLLDPLWVNRSVLRPPPGESCSPVHLTALIRHGSRFPTAKNIQRIRRLSELVAIAGGEATGWGAAGGVATGVGSGEGAAGGGATGGTTGGATGDWLREIRSWENWYTEDMDGETRSRGAERD
ncbi:multiple inositol polyphosphate phosphatase 1-like [Notothenia coriiceps]|uniref:Multiple inositol polyphosphate phosphatase 1-like n=1 Tax=Notothenia coriiceps TaxID=8208 RepID=A0A6I9NRL0_9TELE|nr:PREDICTED: multiple inositol polyphosphate phosphatase 1-like [Notothenia coriiceps]